MAQLNSIEWQALEHHHSEKSNDTYFHRMDTLFKAIKSASNRSDFDFGVPGAI